MKRSQLRAARALLSWSQERLADAAGVSLPTIKRLEPGDGPLATRVETHDKLKSALEGAGVIFVEENGEGPGVRLRKQRTGVPPPKPTGPATDALHAMDAAIEEHRRGKAQKR